jgi:hypothetical protein
MKLDFQAIERYAKQYAAKVCDDFLIEIIQFQANKL